MLLSRYDFLKVTTESKFEGIKSWCRRNAVPIHYKNIYITRSNGSKALTDTSFIDSEEIFERLNQNYRINNKKYHHHYDNTKDILKKALKAKQDAEEHIFTFGSDQKYPNSFISIYNTDDETARTEMFSRFGPKWSMHYEPPNARKKAGVNKWNLKQVQ